MDSDFNNTNDITPSDPESLATENEILKLKMMAEMGAVFGPTHASLTPEMERKFLDQVLTTSQNFAEGKFLTFSETTGPLTFRPFIELQKTSVDLEAMIDEVLGFYRHHQIEVSFQFDYPTETQYRFLVEELPTLPNHMGAMPGMVIGIAYEDFHPNHGAAIESASIDFIEALRLLDVHSIQLTMSPVQFLPEGPYPLQTLLDALQERFDSIHSLENFEYMIAETSYDLETEEGEEIGMGYTEGLVKFDVLGKNGDLKNIHGPFKLYFHYEQGIWAIMYLVFPGIKYPPLPHDDMRN